MAIGNGVPVVLKTKLHRPPLQGDLVVRTQLLRKLDAGLGGKLTLVCAPAGFGKTTLVASWLAGLEASDAATQAAGQAHEARAIAWLAVDRHDNNPTRFLTYLVAAIVRAYPDSCPNTAALLRMVSLPPADYLAEILTDELEQLPGKLIIAFDDFQEVQEFTVLEIIATVLTHLPGNVHLVLVTRLDPALPLARLRVQQQITEVRAAELRFNVAEAAAFFEKALGHRLPVDLVRSLDARAEGWAAGLRLAVLSLRDDGDPASFVSAFHGTQHHIMDFLVEQVMAHQPPAVVEFLTRTSMLEMLCAPLCDALLEGIALPVTPVDERFVATVPGANGGQHIDSRAVLNYLERSNLFVVALDARRHWYRFHHLFREMLQFRLEGQCTATDIAAAHRRAAAWLAHNGHTEAAVRQLLATDDLEQAADLIEATLPDALGNEAWSSVRQLLALLPQAIILQRPVLTLGRAWLLSVMQRLDELPPLLRQAEAVLAKNATEAGSPPPPWLMGWLDALWSLLLFINGDIDAGLRRSQAALATVPASHVYVRGITCFYRAAMLQCAGQTNEAIQFYQGALAAEREQAQFRIAYAPSLLAAVRGDLDGFGQLAGDCLRPQSPAAATLLYSWGHLHLGILAYERNHLAEAIDHFTAAYGARPGSAAVVGLDAACGLALAYQALGDHEEAANWAAVVTQLATESQSAYFISAAAWFQQRLALQRGAAPSAMSAHRWCLGVLPLTQMRWCELPDLTCARVLVAQGGKANLAEALAVLDRLLDCTRRYHLAWREIEVLAVRALALHAQGKQNAALETLAAAVKLAQPQGYVRTFVDLGPTLAGLLHMLAQQGVAAEYVGRLLAAFPLAARNAVAVAVAERTSEDIIEPLSEREVEVLGLLAERLTDKEIAEQLRISPLTVRRHSVNLYQKLHVNSRRQAVARAQALGLLRIPA